jgi:hypothetical protein
MNNGLKMPRIKFQFDPKRKVYERQPGEPDKAWKAFTIYRNLGFDRSLSKTAKEYQQITESKAQIESVEYTVQKMSAQYHWVSRSAEWDNYLDKVQRRTKVLEIEEMKQRHLKLALSMQGLGSIELKKWLEKVRASENQKTVELSTSDIRALVELGIRLERLNRDEPESVTKTEQEITVDDKRTALQEQLEKDNIWEELKELDKRLEA